MFADMHITAAKSLGMNPITVFAGQNAGGSLGNLICPNNTVAACATVGEAGHESLVMGRPCSTSSSARFACNSRLSAEISLMERPSPPEAAVMTSSMYNVPFATNVATAEVLVQGLRRGDFGWRDIVNPKNKKK